LREAIVVAEIEEEEEGELLDGRAFSMSMEGWGSAGLTVAVDDTVVDEFRGWGWGP
jgi:hypothetical protein